MSNIRRYKILTGDLVTIAASVWLSYAIRISFSYRLLNFTEQALLMSVLALIVKAFIFHLSGIYRIYWRHIGTREWIKLFLSATISSLLLSLLILSTINLLQLPISFPRSVLAIDWLVSFLGFVIYRMVAYPQVTMWR